jgi:hypothetical protein
VATAAEDRLSFPAQSAHVVCGYRPSEHGANIRCMRPGGPPELPPAARERRRNDVIRCSDLCDFCNAQEFFYGSHGAGQIFYSDVMNLLQQGGLSS